MIRVRCPQGHYYAERLFSACPYCGSKIKFHQYKAPTGEIIGSCGENVLYKLYPDGKMLLTGTGDTDDYLDADALVEFNSPFEGNDEIQAVVVEDGVTRIGDWMFHYCRNLKHITLPRSLRSIGNWTFAECGSLETLTIPDGVVSIGSFAFFGCARLAALTVSASVKEIGADAFSGCPGAVGGFASSHKDTDGVPKEDRRVSGNSCIHCFSPLGEGPVCPRCGFDHAAYAPKAHYLRPGVVLREQYVVGRALGQGGFGITYAGFDTTLNIRVAVKEFFPADMVWREAAAANAVSLNPSRDSREDFDAGLSRFLNEAQALARLDDIPGVVRVKDHFRENNTAYIVMEFVEGVTLHSYLTRLTKRPSFQEALDLLAPVGEALKQIHARHFVHRDVSPDNIMITAKGRPVLLDFGAVKTVTADGNSTQTPIVKRGFSPVEMYSADGKIGPWSDVYAYCATLYYMLTGKILQEPMNRLTGDTTAADLSPFVPADRLPALLAGLAIRPEERCRDMARLLAALNACQDDPPPPPKPKYIVAILAAAAMAALCLVIGVSISKSSGRVSVDDATSAGRSSETITVDSAAVPPETKTQDTGSRVLMEADNYSGYVFGNQSFLKSEIISVEFLDSLSDMPSVGTWDVSAEQDGSVIAWTRSAAEGYELYIAANGTIIANENSGCMFAGNYTYPVYNNLKSIRFNGVLDTSGATVMRDMFYGCESLQTLDVSSFDTSEVTEMQGMFGACFSLQTLDLSNFDTAKVTNMRGMFEHCKSLQTLNLQSFDTSHVTATARMFQKCDLLKTLDLRSFSSQSLEDYVDMFTGTTCEVLVDPSQFTIPINQ